MKIIMTTEICKVHNNKVQIVINIVCQNFDRIHFMSG